VSELRQDLRELVEESPFYAWTGITVATAEPRAVRLELELQDHHRNIQGFAHGGTLATIADAAMGLSVRSAREPGRRHVTIELAVHYLRPATTGRIAASGKVIRVGTEIAFAEAVVTEANGRELVRATGTYSVTRGR
jgi:uncharacterized protein (TIGR00369 family)